MRERVCVCVWCRQTWVGAEMLVGWSMVVFKTIAWRKLIGDRELRRELRRYVLLMGLVGCALLFCSPP